MSGYDYTNVNLAEALLRSPDDLIGDPIRHTYSEKDVQSLIPRPDNQDANEGPRRAWHLAHAGNPRAPSFSLDENEHPRHRAYVFWDWDRIRKYDMLDILGHRRETSPFPVEAYREMEESITTRSDIWHLGGSGYWSRDDASRIMWSRPLRR